jgi:hypothetical protein
VKFRALRPLLRRAWRSWVLELTVWVMSGALVGGIVTARVVNDLLNGTPAVAEVVYTPTPIPKPTPTYVPTATIIPTATLVPTPRPTISASPLAKAAASMFALNRQ